MYANRLVRDMLKTAVTNHSFTGGAVATFTTRPLNDVPEKLPVVRARAQNPADSLAGFQKNLDVVVDVWAADEDLAYEVSKFIYDHLRGLWKNQTPVADGWIRKFDCPVYPGLVDDPVMADQVVRYLANYDLTIRHN